MTISAQWVNAFYSANALSVMKDRAGLTPDNNQFYGKTSKFLVGGIEKDTDDITEKAQAQMLARGAESYMRGRASDAHRATAADYVAPTVGVPVIGSFTTSPFGD